MNHLRANGLDFAYLEEGAGPLVILLHGFPDTAHTWDHQLSALAAAGYRAVAPDMRGYFPTQIPRDGFYDKATLAGIKAMLGEPGVLSATLGYYRAMFDPLNGDPRLEALRATMDRPISVPTLALCGADDLRAELMTGQAPYFHGEYHYQLVPGAGHFLQREQPAEVTRLILDWLGVP